MSNDRGNIKRIPQVKSKNWRIVIPNLQEYQNVSSGELQELKRLILERLKHRPQYKDSSMKSEFERGLRYYRIALEHHANGIPHLDILLVYDKSIKRRPTDYDYLYKHGDVTTYRQLNRAIIEYGKKEDKHSLSNFPEDTKEVLIVQELKKDPFRYLYRKMKEDPLKFSLEQYVQKNELAEHISGWSSIKTKLKDMQVAAANLSLRKRTTFKSITPEVILERLTSEEYKVYLQHRTLYDRIIAKLNEVVEYRFQRPFKSKQLLLVGPPDTGKTSLIRELQKHCSVYHMDISNWFPAYKDHVYSVIAWNQFKLKGGMTHTDLLKFLEGYPMDLQYKGGSSLRRDNQLIVMTSNMTLEEHLRVKFREASQRALARANLSARIEQITLPPGVTLFVLNRLLF